MNKSEFVVEIMNLCDENERLKNELQIIKNDSLLNQKVIEKQPSRMILELIKIGENRMFTDCLRDKQAVSVTYDNKTNICETTPFECWLDKKIFSLCIPKSISQVEFEEYFSDQLHEMYEKEKESALREAKGIENVEDE